MSQSKASFPLIGFACVLLGTLFTGLKLTGHIDWDWWLVLLPFYAPFAFALLVMLVVLPGLMLAAWLETRGR